MLPLPEATELVGTRRQCLVGRGATALWVALRAMAARDGFTGEVILPDLICPAVLEATVAAGYVPVLGAVDPECYGLDPRAVEALIGPDTHAILLAHLFGHVMPIARFERLVATRPRVRLIEDAVQAIGGRSSDGVRAGSRGDFAFVSFDPSKPIRARGAVLLFDDEGWEPFVATALRQVSEAACRRTSDAATLAASQRNLYHGLGQAVRVGALTTRESTAVFSRCMPAWAELLLTWFDEEPANQKRLANEWQTLAERVRARNARALELRECLAGCSIEPPPVAEGDAIWRYSVRFASRGLADCFTSALLATGAPVSRLYYPLSHLYAQQRALDTGELAGRLVNLWVDESAPPDYARRVRDAAHALAAGAP